jgi:thioredoxin reductase (NADPH)
LSEPVILVIDDDPQVLGAIRRDLKTHYQTKYRVLAAQSGETAVQTAKELKTRGDALAMIISDQRMPGMLGVDVLSQCRELYPFARRVLLTAYSDIQAAVRAINEAHLNHYLEKPWDPPEERLYPPLDELLSQWEEEYRPEIPGLRVVGHPWSPRAHAIKEFLGGNLVPYRWLELGHDPEAKVLTEVAGVSNNELPAVILDSGEVLRNPELHQIAEVLGLAHQTKYDLYDVVSVGAGPAGLAAAVYGASEGMKTLLLDSHGPGGQAGASSRIENYLGFPHGVSGSDLARRAVTQAQRLGAEFMTHVEVLNVSVEGGYKRLALRDGRVIVARAVIAATGMTYREHAAEGIAERTGAGIYYGAAVTEAHSCKGRRVYIVGGGNSAGQSAVYLARFASEVHLVVRRDSLAPTMSDYLIRQLRDLPNVRIRTALELERVEGEGRLERVWLKSKSGDPALVEEADALFIFIGTRPHSNWLPTEVLRNDRGFVLTGRDLRPLEDFLKVWKEDREPFPLETSIAGLFAAGDVRAGAMNRVASAVGEGSMCIKLVSDYLAET